MKPFTSVDTIRGHYNRGCPDEGCTAGMDKHALPQDWKEARRQRAFELKAQGWQQRAIARALGVSDKVGQDANGMKLAPADGGSRLRRSPPSDPPCWLILRIRRTPLCPRGFYLCSIMINR
jgi:hypothetical protein